MARISAESADPLVLKAGAWGVYSTAEAVRSCPLAKCVPCRSKGGRGPGWQGRLQRGWAQDCAGALGRRWSELAHRGAAAQPVRGGGLRVEQTRVTTTAPVWTVHTVFQVRVLFVRCSVSLSFPVSFQELSAGPVIT